jgi:rRNA-processing protein FCF1
MYSIININFFFIIYKFYFNVPSTIKDDYSKKKIFITKKIIKKIKSEDKKLAKQ